MISLMVWFAACEWDRGPGFKFDRDRTGSTVTIAPSPDPTGPTDPPDPTDPPVTDTATFDSVSLTVEGGFGSGQFSVGATVHAWADVDPQRAIVAGWSGDAVHLTSPSEWNSALVMPAADVVIAPDVVEVAAPVQERSYALDGGDRRVLIAHGEGDVVGLVLHFHGGIYAVDNLWDNAPRTITMHLVRAGYTVVALQSNIEALFGTGGWDWDIDPSANGDLRNALDLIAALHADGTVDPSVPTYAWGMSSGGQFAHSLGTTGAVAAVAAHCAAGTSAAMAVTTRPTAWFLMERDQTFPTAVADATGYAADFAARQIPTDLHVQPPTPLYDARFTRVGGSIWPGRPRSPPACGRRGRWTPAASGSPWAATSPTIWAASTAWTDSTRPRSRRWPPRSR